MEFQNYRDCGYTCNPHKFEIPTLRFPCRVPVIPCKDLQCRFSPSPQFQWGLYQTFFSPILDWNRYKTQPNIFVWHKETCPLCSWRATKVCGQLWLYNYVFVQGCTCNKDLTLHEKYLKIMFCSYCSTSLTWNYSFLI